MAAPIPPHFAPRPLCRPVLLLPRPSLTTLMSWLFHFPQVHSVMHMGANHCDYGVLPGYLSFNVMKPVGERWQVRTPHPAAQPEPTSALCLGNLRAYFMTGIATASRPPLLSCAPSLNELLLLAATTHSTMCVYAYVPGGARGVGVAC